MRLRQIEVFHSVYVNGSISAAARALNVSQPSVSKVLHHTQDTLGFQLFELVRGRLVPTDEAHALFREVDDVFGRLTSLQQAVENIKKAGGGHIRLAVVPSLGLAVAPIAIARFRDRFPEVTFEIQTLHHDDMFRALYERECDIAFSYDPPAHHRVKRATLAQGRIGLLYKAGEYPDAPSEVPLASLNGKDLIGLTASGPLGDLLAAEMKRQDVEIREIVSVQTFYVAAALVNHGAGMTLVDEFTARASANDQLAFRPIAPALEFNVECIYLEDRPPASVARKFIEQFRAVLAAQQGRA